MNCYTLYSYDDSYFGAYPSMTSLEFKLDCYALGLKEDVFIKKENGFEWHDLICNDGSTWKCSIHTD